jgi:hypothetical protein
VLGTPTPRGVGRPFGGTFQESIGSWDGRGTDRSQDQQQAGSNGAAWVDRQPRSRKRSPASSGSVSAAGISQMIASDAVDAICSLFHQPAVASPDRVSGSPDFCSKANGVLSSAEPVCLAAPSGVLSSAEPVCLAAPSWWRQGRRCGPPEHQAAAGIPSGSQPARCSRHGGR